jgi:hypothetical protein
MPRRRRIRVKYGKLGRANAWGLAHTDSYVVELDERLKGKKHLEILLHEVVHVLMPDASEEETERISIGLTHVLWSEGYRRIDNRTDEPLQDGSL